MSSQPSTSSQPSVRLKELSQVSGHETNEPATPTPAPKPALPGLKRVPNGLVYRHAFAAVLWAMVFNIVVGGLKLGVALTVTPSAVLFSEGLHSLADALNSTSLLFGIIQGKRPPDRAHPFGYGLETNFWAMLSSLVMLGGASWAFYSGWQRFSEPEPLEGIGWAMAILVASLVMEVFALYTASQAVLQELGLSTKGGPLIYFKALRHVRQVVGPTTRFVFWEDTLAFIGAAIALITLAGSQVAVTQGWLPEAFAHWPDAIGSLLISVLLLILAIKLFRYNRSFLIGAAASETVEARILDVTNHLHGVSKVHDLKTIDQGLAGLQVHLKIEVAPETQVKDVDDLIDHVKDQLATHVPHVHRERVLIEVIAYESKTWEDMFSETVASGVQEGVLKHRDQLMLKNVYEFSKLVVSDIMIPRRDVEYVSNETPLNEIADLMLETGHSRLPVYDAEDVDSLIGLVRFRDVFALLRRDNPNEGSLAEIIHELDIYPENKPVSDLLEEFKRKKIQMAAVADEHGGFIGLVTIEDLLEQIVGDIFDEDDIDLPEVARVSDKELRLSGRVEIDELNERFALNIPTDEFKTIGGYVFGVLGREPLPGDVVRFEELQLTVQDVERARIETILLSSPVELIDREALMASDDDNSDGDTTAASSSVDPSES